MQAVMLLSLWLALIINVGLLGFALTRQDRSRSIYFAALAGVVFLYCLGYLAELLSPTVEAVTTALWVENFSIPMVAPLFLLTAISLFQPRLLRRWMLPAVLAYGMAVFTTVLFNGHHGLYYIAVELRDNGHFLYAHLTRGPLFAVQQGLTLLFTLSAYALLFVRFVRGSRKLRTQMSFFILGSFVGFLANVLNFTGTFPSGVDPTPFALTIGMIFFSINLFRHQLMDIVTVAFTRAVETMDDAIVVLDGDWGYVYSNRSAKQLFPSLELLSGTEHITEAAGWPAELAPTGVAGQVSFFRGEAGQGQSAYRANISQVQSDSGHMVGWSVVIRDTSDTQRLMNQMEKLAITDPLTGIYNRRQFLSLTERELSMAQRHNMLKAMILFDIDNFKLINDRFGHAVGDEVLCHVVEVVKAELRAEDLFARYGGEEFAIFGAGGTLQDLHAFGERLRSAVEEAALQCAGQAITVTASFGVVSIPPGCDFGTAMRAADDAMYEAKSLGRNCVVVQSVSSLIVLKTD